MFHRLVRWPIFPYSDRIMGEDMNHWNFHQGAQADRRAAVVAEDQKSRSKGSDFRQGQTIENSTHGVLANAKVEIPPGRILSAKIPGAFAGQAGLAGGSEIRRTP